MCIMAPKTKTPAKTTATAKKVAKKTTAPVDVPPPPPAPSAPSKYAGPGIRGILGEEVFFESGKRIKSGESADGVDVLRINGPFSVRLGWRTGEYEVNLSVTNSAGSMDGDKIKVYVSYYGEWKDFQIDGNNSGSPKVIEFDMPVVYDRDQGNTIRKVETILTYPQLDDDQFTDVENTLNLYAFNEEDEEASNTSETANENRDAGDCDDDENYCVMLLLSSYMFTDTESTYGDGEWLMQIRNNRWNDVQIESMVIILHYK